MPRLLDLFCGAGGAARGYADAGFEIVGVDHEPQPEYPYEFVQADAITFAMHYARSFDAVHASPPCQSQSLLTKGTNRGNVYPNLIPQTREVLRHLSVPTIIENVRGSELRPDLILCGEMFSLAVIRHRYFEIENCIITTPRHYEHRGRVQGWRHGVYYDGPYFAVYGRGGGKGSLTDWQRAMGIDWITDHAHLAEAIPPAFTNYIGKQLMSFV